MREKAKQLVNLLRDDERLKQERTKAFKARERFAQNAMGISSDNKMTYATSSARAATSYADPHAAAAAAGGSESLSADLEAVRPSDNNEEELQIKLALMLSQQEHEEAAQKQRADEAKLQLALEQSKSEGQPNGVSHTHLFFCSMLHAQNLFYIHILYTQRGLYSIFEYRTNFEGEVCFVFFFCFFFDGMTKTESENKNLVAHAKELGVVFLF